MKPVARDELVDYQTYADTRSETRARVMELKKPRRIHLGEHLTFLFENRDTIRYQVQEMMRAERIVRDAEIQHELDTYNAVLGGPGELGCTLLIEIESPEQRDVLLREWLGLPAALYARLDDGTRVHATYDPAQVGEDRLSSVQYLKFAVGGRVPVALGVDLDALKTEAELSEAQLAALGDDLSEG
jgi:Protein of unknown function (DUF3501)